MIFTANVTVPAGTLASAPSRTTLPLAHGIMHLVEVSFLDGPEGLVHVALARALHQVVPTNPEGSIVGNDTTVRAQLWEPAEEPPYELEIQAWSPDCTYAHLVDVRVHVLPREVLQPPVPELNILRKLGKLVFGG